MSKTPRFKADEIVMKTLKGQKSEHYNIVDSETKQKVGTCYKKENADLVTDALNAFKNK